MKKRLFAMSLISLISFSSLLGCSNNEVEPPIEEDGKFNGVLAEGPTLPEGEYGIAIRYTRKDNKYDDRGLWIWEVGSEGVLYEFDTVDDFGAVCFLPLSTWSDSLMDNGLGIITRNLTDWNGQSADLIFNFNEYTPDENNYYNVFIREGENNLFDNPDLVYSDKITSAAFTGSKVITVKTTNVVDYYKLYEGNEILEESAHDDNTISYTFKSESDIKVDKEYRVEVKFKDTQKTLTATLSKRALYRTDNFNDTYYYDGELGAIYSPSSTTFRVWSPFSESIKLRLYDNGTPVSINSTKGDDTYIEKDMVKGEKGVFEVTIEGDLGGKYYTYVVTNDTYKNEEIVDPYAKSTGINGLRGMIVDFSKTDLTPGFDNLKINDYSRNELVIYETHVADITSSSTWTGLEANRLKYGGLIEEGTTYTEEGVTVKTGFDHIKDLGVNAIQLLPIFDQANNELKTGDDAFNWGYNPLNYNALDGIYSLDPYDGYTKIIEFKNVVQTYTEAGINVIMDVVYNHVSSALRSNFDVLFPEYYFRYKDDGTLSNGSGCGNEIASEHKMASKFIIDSTKFWAEEYKLGGFRFDLMGLHDLNTMNEVAFTLHNEVDSSIFIHGEPWTGDTTTMSGANQAKQDNIKKFEGYGAFNDKFRDALIKGGLSGVEEKGWATDRDSTSKTDYDVIKKGILGGTGSLSSDPSKATNYVTCHDNYTLYDRIKATGYNGNDEEIAKMATLSNAVILTSQGTSFILAGEEMLRSKNGDNNSYESGYKVNELDYSRLIDFKELHQNYKDLIKFKTSSSHLHLNDSEEIKEKVVFNEAAYDNKVLDYEITREGVTYRFIHSNGNNVDVTLDLSDYEVIIDTSNKEIEDYSSYKLNDLTSLVLRKK